jgi:hypothetical protein
VDPGSGAQFVRFFRGVRFADVILRRGDMRKEKDNKECNEIEGNRKYKRKINMQSKNDV